VFLRLAQDAAWIHSERLGFTRAWYEDRGLAWLVRAVALDIPGAVRYGDDVAVTTRVVGYRRIWARRRTDVRRHSEILARVVTDWILTDTEGRPTRIPDAIPGRLPAERSAIEPLRVGEPPSRPPDVSISGEVRLSELDPLAHVNNAAYVDRVLDLGARLEGDRPRNDPQRPSLVLVYLAAAGQADRTTEEAWTLRDDEGGAGMAYRMSVVDRGPIVRAIVRA
jgi:acyl-ACP thioesterase